MEPTEWNPDALRRVLKDIEQHFLLRLDRIEAHLGIGDTPAAVETRKRHDMLIGAMNPYLPSSSFRRASSEETKIASSPQNSECCE